MPDIVMHGVEELGEGFPVRLEKMPDGRHVIKATNEGGYNETGVVLETLVSWLKANGFENILKIDSED